MDDDFDNDVDMTDNLDESLDLGDLGEGSVGDADSESLDESSDVGGSRSSGGARANARMTQPEPASVRAPRPPAPKAKKAATPARGKTSRGPVKAAKKKSAAKKTAGKKAAKKKAGGKKKA